MFAANLMACGLCFGFYFGTLPLVSSALAQWAKQADVQRKAQFQPRLDALTAQETSAQTVEEKIEIAREKQRIEDVLNRPALPNSLNLEKLGVSDPRMVRFMYAELATGLCLNVLMLLSGIALLRFKHSGLSLGFWVAIAKILRLVLLYGFFIVGIVPWYSHKMAEYAVAEIEQQNTPGMPIAKPPPLDVIGRIYMVMLSVYAVCMILLGTIYPAICAWLLTRPGARAACAAAEKLEARWKAL